MVKIIRILAAASLFAASPALAQAIDPARIEAATELARVLDVRGEMRRAMVRQIGDMRSGAAMLARLDRDPRFKTARSKNPRQFDIVFKRIGGLQASAAERALGDAEAEAVRANTAAYARNFSTSELRQLIAFYQSPLGRVLRERTPAVSQATQAAMQARLGPRMAEELRRIAPQIQSELRRLSPATPQPADLTPL